MKRTLLIFLLLLFATSVFSQTKTIRWNSPDAPKDCCTSYFKDNRLITNYKDENIFFQIGVDVETEKKFVAVLVTFANPSDKSFTIFPDNFQMILTAPENKTYNALPIEEVAKKIENRGKWKSFAAILLAGMATRSTTAVVTDNNGNRADVKITEQDKDTQKRAGDANRERKAKNQERADIIKSIALPAHTLFKDDVKGGFVFFKKEDLTPGMIISFTVGDTTYEIPYGTERNPNK